MKYRPHSCEVCSADDWQVFGRRIYSSDEIGRAEPYQADRYRVLFDKWFPGAASVELEWIYCTRCGFAVLSPRPEAADITDKYRYLAELAGDDNPAPGASPVEGQRSRVIRDYLNKHVDLAAVKEVLDYGGGDGRLMRTFLDNGKTCFLVDYYAHTMPGVTKLGDTIGEVSPERNFDLIVCSHVLEHVAEPREVVRSLIERLRPGGTLFVEVPLDLWARQELPYDPVTHINFFTPNNVWNLLALAGLPPLRSELTMYLNASGRRLHGIRALAVRTADGAAAGKPKLKRPDVMNYMKPGLLDTFRYHAVDRHVLWQVVKRKLFGR